MKTTKQDLALFGTLHPYTSPKDVPVTYTVGGKIYRGFPEELSPNVNRRRIDSRIHQTTVTATTPEGLTLRAECTEYNDFPVVEWVMYITNETEESSPIISDWAIDLDLPCTSPRLYHGNGDSKGGKNQKAYDWWLDPITEEATVIWPLGDGSRPNGDGTSCSGAFPYMRLLGEKNGINLAIGWTGTWKAVFKKELDAVRLSVSQNKFRSYLKPGETVRTPSLTLQAFDGGDERGRNLWRSFYMAHILPHQDGRPLDPKLVLHTFGINDLPEFCGTTEENQLNAIDVYLKRGLKPDIWWIDAGWYPCNNEWPNLGAWYPNPENHPNGLGPIGKKLEKEGIDFLLWFEPERARKNSEIRNEHPEFFFFFPNDEDEWLDRDGLFKMGDPEARAWMTDHIDRLIKDSGITVYRQDFNFDPAPYWEKATEADREGILENLHIQGYYAFWDELLARNPRLWIDSCAAGGRRNDIETMKRAVPLHYTDCGYGNHLIKQKQHRQMFEWIPYFRAHTYNWDEPDGTYGNKNHPIDAFAYQNATTPAITSTIEYYDSDEIFDLGKKFHPIWRRAATLELNCDYYPLTECKWDPSDWYAMQFDNDDEGFVQIIRNINVKDDSITLTNLHLDLEKAYTFTDEWSGSSFTVSGKELAQNGLQATLPPRSGLILFYKKS